MKIVLGLMFVGAAGAKLAGVPQMVAEFDTVGLGQWFRYFTAIVELAGAALLVAPKTTVYGASLLTCVCIGAFFAQLLAIHQDVVHTIVIGGILAAIAWRHRERIRVR